MSSQNYGLEEQIARAADRLRPMIARQKAKMLGPAPGARKVTGATEIELWNERAQGVDVLTEYGRFVAQGMSLAKAQAMATLKAYPNRAEMMSSYASETAGDPNDGEAQQRYAERMARLSQQGVTDVPGPY